MEIGRFRMKPQIYSVAVVSDYVFCARVLGIPPVHQLLHSVEEKTLWLWWYKHTKLLFKMYV